MARCAIHRLCREHFEIVVETQWPSNVKWVTLPIGEGEIGIRALVRVNG